MGSKWILVLGLVLGLVAGALTYVKVASVDEPVEVVGNNFMRLNPETNLAAGERLLPAMINSVTVPLDFNEVKSVAVEYTPEIATWLTNNDVRVSRDIAAGSFILHEHLLDDPQERFAYLISAKNRAISIPVSELTSVAYFIEPGSRIDILTTLSIEGGPAPGQQSNSDRLGSSLASLEKRIVTRTILQDMLVLAVGRSTTRNAYLNSKRGYGSITLDVTPEQAEMLTFLMSESNGGFTLALRNPLNSGEQEIEEVNWQNVLSR